MDNISIIVFGDSLKKVAEKAQLLNSFDEYRIELKETFGRILKGLQYLYTHLSPGPLKQLFQDGFGSIPLAIDAL